MNDAPLTFSSLAALVTIFAAVFGVIFSVLRAVEARIAPRSQDKALGELVDSLKALLARPGQSVQCAAQHENLRGALADNAKRFTEIVQAVHVTAEAVRALAHAQELRDERLKLQLQLISDRMEHGHRETAARLADVAKAVAARREEVGP